MKTQLFIKKAPTILKTIARGLSVTSKMLSYFDISGTALLVIASVALSLHIIAWGLQTADSRGWTS
ncbi:hypothetical protein [Marinobacter salicampi]|uniref:hypothetical protein n=1 Tax=Marinobacter salicampi TaxID=435907 RepID=UPI00140B4A9E|nr:hypothetical protein [Marinobacter salicampi]